MALPETSPRWRLALAAAVCVAAGCTREYEGNRRFPLTGTVRVDGQPMEAGTISFIPNDHDRQRVSGGPITDGVYSVMEAQGANAGTYRVEIHWYKKTGRMVLEAMTGDMVEERKEGLPKRYHKASELMVEVAPGQTTFDFDLKSQ